VDNELLRKLFEVDPCTVEALEQCAVKWENLNCMALGKADWTLETPWAALCAKADAWAKGTLETAIAGTLSIAIF
jgi:hypothetical protein